MKDEEETKDKKEDDTKEREGECYGGVIFFSFYSNTLTMLSPISFLLSRKEFYLYLLHLAVCPWMKSVHLNSSLMASYFHFFALAIRTR